MNYTQNHHLPQWEKDDRIMMEDFNDAMANIDGELTRGPAGVAEAAAKANEKTARAAAAAQSTADQAASAAAKAQATADNAFCPEKMPYAVGTYTGTGTSVSVELGFRPRFLVIAGGTEGQNHNFSVLAGESSPGAQVTFTSTGFTVKRNLNETPELERPPHVVNKGTVYSYIAFR